MEVIILAGGFGTRMRPLTYTRPKPLLPLLNRPMLQGIIDRLPEDVEKIILPVNYLREQIDAYFDEHPDPRVVLVEEKDPLGTGGAIKNCEEHITDTFLVYNGDIVTNLDLNAFRRFHAERGAKITISLWPVDDPSHFGVVEREDDGRIRSFVEKPPRNEAPSNLINAGHYLLEPSVLEAIPPGKFFSIEKELYTPWAEKGKGIYGYPFEGYWIDCGRPETLLEAHRLVLEDRGEAAIVDETARIDDDAEVRSYSVGAGCEVGPGCVVERSILMDGVRLGRNVRIRDAILGEGVEVEHDVDIVDSVVGDHAMVASGSRIAQQKLGMRAADLEA